jgi:hypothetical protein
MSVNGSESFGLLEAQKLGLGTRRLGLGARRFGLRKSAESAFDLGGHEGRHRGRRHVLSQQRRVDLVERVVRAVVEIE